MEEKLGFPTDQGGQGSIHLTERNSSKSYGNNILSQLLDKIWTQPDYVWNQLKPKISGPQLRDFLNLVNAVGRPTLNLSHSGGISIEDWRKEALLCACLPPLLLAGPSALAEAGMKCNFFRIPAQTEASSSPEILWDTAPDWDCRDTQPQGLHDYQILRLSTVRRPLLATWASGEESNKSFYYQYCSLRTLTNRCTLCCKAEPSNKTSFY